MELINNRYRVQKVLSESLYMKSYLVSDVLNRHRIICFNILKRELASEKLITFLTEEFIRLKNLNCKGIVGLYEYGLIDNVDSQPISERLYYFSTEYIDKTIDAAMVLGDLDIEERLDIFCEICCIVNTLYLKGFSYSGIRMEDIFFEKQEEKLQVRLRDIISFMITSNSHMEEPGGDVREAWWKGSIDRLMYQLTALIRGFFQKDEREGENRLAEEMIASMMDSTRFSEITEVSQLIDYIGNCFGRRYRKFIQEDLEKLNFHNKMSGRRGLVEEVLKRVDLLQKGDSKSLLAAIHGGIGTGKTRILDELAYRLKIRGVKVFRHSVNNGTDTGYDIVKLIKQILVTLEAETAKRYEMEFSDTMQDMLNDTVAANENIPLCRKEKYRIINRITALINEVSKAGTILLILDGLDLCDEIYFDLLEYIFQDSTNIMCLFSYNGNSISSRKRLRDFLGRVNNRRCFHDMVLEPLDEPETIEMVKSVLGTEFDCCEIGKTIYSVAYGNPLFVEEVIKDLFLRKELFVDKNTGRWLTNRKDIKEISIPLDLEEAMIGQLRDIDADARKVLSGMAVYDRKMDISILARISGLEEEEVSDILADLIKKGLVSGSLIDGASYYDYSSKILKKMIYDRLDSGQRKNAHKLAVNIIEETDNSDIREDIIYHLEGAGEKVRAYECCIAYADRFQDKNLAEAAIKYLEKAVAIYASQVKDERYAELLLRLGSLYRRIGKIQNALECYEFCVENGYMNKYIRIKIRALNKIALIYYTKNDIEECMKYLEDADRMIPNYTECTEEILKMNLLKVKLLERQRKYEDSFQICRDSLKLCDESRFKSRGSFLYEIGNLYLFTGDILRALESYEQSINCFEAAGDIKGTLGPLSSIGTIWRDYFQDEDKSMAYFSKLKEICEINKILEYDIAVSTNMGEIFFNKFMYEEALRCFFEALGKTRRLGMEASIFYNYACITYTYLMLQDYRNVYKYMNILSEELSQYPDQGVHIRLFYKVMGMAALRFGEQERAEVLIAEAMKRYNNEDSINRWHTQYIKDLINLHSDINGVALQNIIDDIELIISRIKKKQIKLEVLYETCITLYLRGFAERCRMLFDKYYSQPEGKGLNVKRLFIEAVNSRETDKLGQLMNALEAAVQCKNEELRWRICCQIGDYYSEKGNLFCSVNYYFKAAETVRILTNSLPREKRLAYFNFHNMLEPFKKLMHMEKTHERVEAAADKDGKEICSEEKMQRLFNYNELRGVTSNSDFIKSGQSTFDTVHKNSIKDLGDLLKRLSSNPIANLELIIMYLSRCTLAKEAYIFHEELDGSITVLAGRKISAGIFKRNSIIEKARRSKRPVIITDKTPDTRNQILEPINYDNKVIICIPIMSNRTENNRYVKEERRGRNIEAAHISGYVYLEAERFLNNFNQGTLGQCMEVIPLTGFVIEKHLLSISSSIDKLTKTLTRRSLEEVLEELVYKCQDDGREFSVIMFDLDYFKLINDKFGHQAGDSVLSGVSSVVLNNIRKMDCCGRYGGEEFVIVLPDTNIHGAELVAEKIRRKVEEEKLLGKRASVTISLGAASYPVHGRTMEEIIRRADQALYAAKKLGRNRCQVWNENFEGEIDVSDRLAGIISGNLIRDHRNVSAIIEIMSFLKEENGKEEKIFQVLGRILEAAESQQGSYFVVKDDEIENIFSREAVSEKWSEVYFNERIIYDVIKTQKGKCLIDWDETFDYESGGTIPDWKSVAAVPVIKNGVIRAVVALAVSARIKEFHIHDLNFLGVLAQLSAEIL